LDVKLKRTFEQVSLHIINQSIKSRIWSNSKHSYASFQAVYADG